MAHFFHEAQHSASAQSNATPSTQEIGALSEDDLSLRFIARTDEAGNTDVFVQPSQHYELLDGSTIRSSALHQEDLFRMATLLMQAYNYIGTLKNPAADSTTPETSDSME